MSMMEKPPALSRTPAITAQAAGRPVYRRIAGK
jgi:hypothetical protein